MLEESCHICPVCLAYFTAARLVEDRCVADQVCASGMSASLNLSSHGHLCGGMDPAVCRSQFMWHCIKETPHPAILSEEDSFLSPGPCILLMSIHLFFLSVHYIWICGFSSLADCPWDCKIQGGWDDCCWHLFLCVTQCPAHSECPVKSHGELGGVKNASCL